MCTWSTRRQRSSRRCTRSSRATSATVACRTRSIRTTVRPNIVHKPHRHSRPVAPAWHDALTDCVGGVARRLHLGAGCTGGARAQHAGGARHRGRHLPLLHGRSDHASTALLLLSDPLPNRLMMGPAAAKLSHRNSLSVAKLSLSDTGCHRSDGLALPPSQTTAPRSTPPATPTASSAGSAPLRRVGSACPRCWSGRR